MADTRLYLTYAFVRFSHVLLTFGDTSNDEPAPSNIWQITNFASHIRSYCSSFSRKWTSKTPKLSQSGLPGGLSLQLRRLPIEDPLSITALSY